MKDPGTSPAVAAIASRVLSFLHQTCRSGDHLLLALSGGGDSTLLALLSPSLTEAGFKVSAAHVNHHLRGTDSLADQEFVCELGAGLSVPVHLADGGLTREQIQRRGIEAAARERRYGLLEDIRHRLRAEWIVTAHHMDDQAETVLVRLVTGSGARRLRGILPVTPDGTIRPLLGTRRREIRDALAETGVEPRHDRTNDDRRFVRNSIRAEVLPLLEQLNPRIVEALAETAQQAREQWMTLQQLLDLAAASAVEREPGMTTITFPEQGIWLDLALLESELRHLDPDARPASRELRRFVQSEAEARATLTGSVDGRRSASGVVLTRSPGPVIPFDIVLEENAPALLPDGRTATVRRKGTSEQRAGLTQVFVLPDGIRPGQLHIRSRRPGDRFQPLRLAFEKKLKDFLIGRKIARSRRDQLALLVWNDEIVWVAGVEVSERFKIGREGVAYEIAIEDNHE